MMTTSPASSPTESPSTTLRALGKVVGARGLKGELRIRPFNEQAPWVGHLNSILLERPGAPGLQTYTIEKAVHHGPAVFLTLKGVMDRNQAELLKGAVLKAEESELPALEEAEIYTDQLLNLKVFSVATQQELGTIVEVLTADERTFLEILPEGRPADQSVCVPYQAPFVTTVDLDAGQLWLQGLDSLFESGKDDPAQG